MGGWIGGFGLLKPLIWPITPEFPKVDCGDLEPSLFGVSVRVSYVQTFSKQTTCVGVACQFQQVWGVR